MHIIFTEKDKTLGLIVCALSVFALVVALSIYVITGWYAAIGASIWISGWWFGATLVWLGEKHYYYKKNRLS